MYKLRYGRTYNMGNFQSERIEVERDFTDKATTEEATDILMAETAKSHAHSQLHLRAKKAGLTPLQQKLKELENKKNTT